MAAISTALPFISLISSLSSTSPSPCPLRPLPRRPGLKPRLRMCHVKLRGSREGVTGIYEEFFGGGEFAMEDGGDGEADEDETESSLDLLVKFVQSLFKKVSKRARKASLSVLPDGISPQLVVCTLGGAIFVAILLLRLIWAAIAFFQLNGNDFNRRQPVS